MGEIGSRIVASSAIKMALTSTRAEETELKNELREASQIRAVAVDYGGEYIHSMGKIVERAVVAARREGVIRDTHAEEGAVAGAAREAMGQIMTKALGLNVGGKIGIARYKGDMCGGFFGIGLCTWMRWPSVWAPGGVVGVRIRQLLRISHYEN